MGTADSLTESEERQPAPRFSLERPPIVEVVCGFVFDPLPLDGLLLGVYWDQRKDDYPNRGLHPALFDVPHVLLSTTPGRAMLESGDGVHILQLQHDRLYTNWRARGGAYPRFSSGPKGGGLMHYALREYELFSAFCERRAGGLPQPRRAELTKVDVLRRGRDWSDVNDLAKLVPITGTFGDAHQHARRELVLRFVEHHDDEAVIVAISSSLETPGGEMAELRIETRVVRPLEEMASAEACLRAANETANRVFFRLLSSLDRFGVHGGNSP